MQRARVLRGVFRAAIPFALALAGAGCKTAATSAPPGADTVATNPASGPGTSTGREDASAVNSTAKVPDGEPSLSTDGGVEEILPSTRRSAAGLPEPVPDYLSWFRLGRAPQGGGANGTPASGAHYPACRAYVHFPGRSTHSAGDEMPGNIPEGTLIVLEEKQPGGDFISRVRTMARVPEGWKFASYARSSNTAPFSEESETSRCVTCHAAPPARAGAPGVEEAAPASGGSEAPVGPSGIQSRGILE